MDFVRDICKKIAFAININFFCIGYSDVWGTPISKRLKRLRDKHGLTWLRNSMSFHKFTNLGQKFNSDLTKKVMNGVYDETLQDRKCNCYAPSRMPNGDCYYGGQCRRSMVVYEHECTICNKSYVGKTQDFLNERTKQHFGDVWKVIETGRINDGENWQGSGGYSRADAFAKHFAQHCRDAVNSNAVKKRLKEIMKTTIIWQGDRIRCMKSSQTLQCKICMVERKKILHRMRSNKNKIINDNSDIYSSCKCKSRPS